MEIQDLTAEGLEVMSYEDRKKVYSEFLKSFSTTISRNLSRASSSNLYNPHIGKQTIDSISAKSVTPTPADIEKWLKNPRQYAMQLRGVDKYFDDFIMQYKRTTDHFKKILTFRYDLRLNTDFKESDVETVLNSRNRVLSFLQDFNVPYHTKYAMDRFVSNGGAFFYLSTKNDYKTLIELPIDYCYITGRWDRGYTFAIDLTWFKDKEYLQEQMPEVYEYFKTFIEMKNLNLNKDALFDYQYYAVPIEKGFVLTFDTNSVDMIPPLTPIFKDATAIMTYKNLLLQRTALDTWKVIAQKIPLDKNNVPIFNGEQAQMFVEFIQSVLPDGTAVFATPMETQEIDFSNGATGQDNITGRGEELFWRSAGVNGSLMDSSDKSSATMKYSLMNDAGFVEQIYQMFEDFINLQLRLISRKYRFTVKFYGNRYFDLEDAKAYKEVVIGTNGLLGKMYALMGYEPFEVLPTIKLENALQLKDNLTPIISGSQMSGDDIDAKAGAKTKSDLDIGDSGLQTRDNDSNAKRGE